MINQPHPPSASEQAGQSQQIQLARQAQGGAALVTVLLAVALLMLVVVEFTYSSQVDMHLSQNALRVTQAACLAQSGINLGRLVLEKDAKTAGIDALNEEWAEQLPPLPAGDGLVLVQINDEQGKLNLNALRNTNGTIRGPWREVAERLFVLRDVEVQVLDPILDWLDADHFPEPRGAERDHYLHRTPAIRLRNGPFLTLGELSRVEQLTPELLGRLYDVVTVLPSNRTLVNVNTAPADVLAALFPELESDLLDTFVATRKKTPVRGPGELIERLDFPPRDPPPSLQLTTVRSAFFAIHARAMVEPVQQALRVIVQRQKTQVTPISWSPASPVVPKG